MPREAKSLPSAGEGSSQWECACVYGAHVGAHDALGR